MQEILFDSRLELDRLPLGAVSAGTNIRFGIRAAESAEVREIKINVKNDDSGEIKTAALQKVWTDKGYCRFEGSFACADTGLFWYWFTAETDFGSREIGRTGENGAVFADTPVPWQLSVYSDDYTTPDWIKGGVFYHVFVDRFRQGGEHPQKKGAIYRSDWGGVPSYRPDAQGIVRNNDFFGGDLEGIIEKLPYLSELGVNCLYLSPIFEAASNHKYDTSDYMRIDPSFGDEETFSRLCEEAGKLNIHVICDGVFNHTGDDSVYFDRYGNYGGEGAYCSKESPYYSWYTFTNWPDEYESWWGIKTLPQVCEDDPGYREFILGDRGVLRHWMEKGASGWRLDVADELPETFLRELRKSVKSCDPDALIVGEVWEDATTKVAYGCRRHYFDGTELDAVMNYPFKNAVIDYMLTGRAEGIRDVVEEICENYPKPALNCLMNILGTHDSPRILTALSGVQIGSRDERAAAKLNAEDLKSAKTKLRLASVIQCTLPGVPCIYYGDEAGMEGYEDPFNRRCYPWWHEDVELVEWYKELLSLRRSHKVFEAGEYRTLCAKNGIYAYNRVSGEEKVYVVVNMGSEAMEFPLTDGKNPILTYGAEADGSRVKVSPLGCVMIDNISAL